MGATGQWRIRATVMDDAECMMHKPAGGKRPAVSRTLVAARTVMDGAPNVRAVE